MSNIFQIKRGSGVPTTTALSLDGELGYDKTNKTLYINNNGTIEVPFARVKVNNIDGTLPVSKGGTGQTSVANIQAGKDGDGNTISSTYLKLDGGTMTGNIVFGNNNIGIQRVGRSVSWNKGRDSAIIKTTSLNGYGALASIKTTNGSWDIGAYNNASFTDDLLFTYVTDTQYDGTSAVSTAQIKILENGHIVGTLDGNATNVTGTVSVANGGTGATNRKNAVDSLIYLGTNQTNLLSSTSSSTTGAYGHCIAWFNQSSTDSKKPTDYGMLLQIANGGEISQLWFEHLNGAIYHRGMNDGHAPSTVGWKKIYDTNMSYTRSSIGTIDWGTNDDYLITKAALAYWNGAYSGTTSNLSILGTVTKGTWNGSAIAIGYGGTGATTKVNAQKNLGIQAGTTTANSSSITSVTFSPAFSNVPKVVASWATTSTNESGTWGTLKISEITKTGFKIAAAGSNPSTNKNVEWIAIDNA